MNEIITYGRYYDLNLGIKTFVSSAKKINSNVTVISDNLSTDVLNYLSKNQVNVIDANELSKKYNIQTTLSPYTLKVIYFYLYIKNICSATNVYLCDFTDIFFQKDPFSLIQTNKCYVTSENNKIEKCSTNTTWINICYNQDIYNLLKHNEILNGGNIFGQKEACIVCLKEMCSDMTQIISRIGNYPNIDQASLNKVVYFDRARYEILNKLEIANLAHHGNCQFNFSADKQITIYNTAPFVLHQYDVVKQIQHIIHANL